VSVASSTSPSDESSVNIQAIVSQLLALDPTARGAAITAMSGGLDAHLGIQFTSVDAEQVVGHIELGPQHTQPYGLVHGGVYCALVEALGSTGAALVLLPKGLLPVGVENHTRFIKGVRAGTRLDAVAKRTLHEGRKCVFTVRVLDADGELVAEGTLTARGLPPGQSVGGAPVLLSMGSD